MGERGGEKQTERDNCVIIIDSYKHVNARLVIGNAGLDFGERKCCKNMANKNRVLNGTEKERGNNCINNIDSYTYLKKIKA